MENVKKTNPLRRHLLKLISLLSAVILWFYILGSESYEVEQKISLDYIVPREAAISNVPVSEVTVSLKGPRIFMRNIFSNQQKIALDLTSYSYKFNRPFTVFIKPHHVPILFGMDVVRIVPNQIQVELDKKIFKKISIKPKLTGTLMADYRLMNYKVKPSEIMIAGPREVMRKVSRLNTKPINLSQFKNSGKMEVKLADSDSRIEMIDRDNVEFIYEIRPQKANMTLEKVKIRYLSTHRRFTSSVKYVSLDVLVPEELKGKLKKEQVQVIADLPEGKRGWHKVELRAVLPDEIHLLQIRPESIKVKIK